MVHKIWGFFAHLSNLPLPGRQDPGWWNARTLADHGAEFRLNGPRGRVWGNDPRQCSAPGRPRGASAATLLLLVQQPSLTAAVVSIACSALDFLARLAESLWMEYIARTPGSTDRPASVYLCKAIRQDFGYWSIPRHLVPLIS